MTPDHDPVEMSDVIDERIRMLRSSAPGPPWLLAVLMFVVVVGQVVTLLSLRDVTSAHDRLIRVEVTGLKKTISEQEKTIADYQEVVQQATDGLILMGRTITELGGTPPTIVLRPSSDDAARR